MEKNNNINLYQAKMTNIGLYFTLSLGIITLSSNKVIKDNLVNLLLNIIGIIFLYISYKLTLQLEKNKNDNISIILKNVMLLLVIIMVYSLFNRKII